MKTKVRELSDLTDLFVSKVREVMGARKIFGRIFVYDGMDYIKVVSNEMNQLRAILTMYGIDLGLNYYSDQPKLSVHSGGLQ